MKNILKFLLLILFITLVSCEEFLKEEPLGLNTSASSFKTESDAWAALNAVYDVTKDMGIRASQSSNSTWLFSMLQCCDDMHYRAKNTQVREITNFSYTPSNILLLTVWYYMYNGIARANNVLENVDRVDMNAVRLNQIKGEARFLRGMFYFYLVRIFGDVPLIDYYMGKPDMLSRSTAEKVYEIIISDFKFAYENLPSTTTELGRATSGAAAAFLAKVYLTRKEWSDASFYADKVIQSGVYSLVPNIRDYFDDNKKEQNTEAIFEAQAAHQIGYQGTLFRYMNHSHIPENSAVPGYVITGSPMQMFMASWDLFFSYDDEDDRKNKLIHVIAWKRAEYPPIPLDSIEYPWTYKYTTTSPPSEIYAPNFPLMRYSDVLLMHAEALNEQNKTSDAYPWINLVRRRAFGYPVDAPCPHDLPAGLSKSDFREAVYKERRLEFAAEGQRWFDLVRTGRLISTLNAFSLRLEQEFNDPALSVMSRLEPGTALFVRNSQRHIINPVSEKHMLYPLPQLEIDGNLLLVQNPGY
jgi:starch-binding outer membrane protein, SusD/RagB family